MILEILLSATMEAGLGLLTEIGLEDTVRDVREQLLKTNAKKRARALQKAFDAAVRIAGDPEIQPLLEHRPFQEEVVRALLDPLRGFDVQSLAAYWGEKFPEHALALRKFFNALQNTLLLDANWGAVLTRYQELRFQKEVREALQARRLPLTDGVLVQAVSQSLERYRAELDGNGAIAQGPGAKAVGAGGTLVEGDYQHIVQVTINQFLGGEDPSLADDDRRRYLGNAARQANLLPWTKVTTDYADPAGGEGLRLADVYIDLDTTELRHVEREEELRQFLRQQREAERISAQEMVNRQGKLLIMGDPGSGKSTFVKHLTYLMAQAGLSETPEAWLERLGDWERGVLLPVRIELRQAAAFAKENASSTMPLVLGYVRHALEEWGIPRFWDTLNNLLSEDTAQVLFLLDGLDEVPTDQRQQIVDAVNALCSLYPQQRYVVTCRPYAYVGQPWKLQGFHEVTLAPFSTEQIDRFIENWYEQLAARERIPADEAREKARSLKQAVRRRDLLGLAERPLLMTVMAQLHAYKGKLPEDRTQLYADAVDLLLERWESRIDTGGVLEYLAIPGLKMSDLKSGLYAVAYEAHRSSPNREETADIGEEQLRRWLAPFLNGSWDKAGEFIEFIRERAGLLIRHKTNAYTFPHRSFQEYLAACHWLSLPDYPGTAARLMSEDWDRWREVFVLSAGYAARTDRLGLALAALNALMPENYREGAPVEAYQARLAELTAQALIEIGLVGVRREAVGKSILKRAQDWLVAALQADTLTPLERAEAGRALAKLGDPRPGVLEMSAAAFVHIPAGRFVVGTRQQDIPELMKKYGGEQDWYEIEIYQHELILDDYWITRYPVTNAQFWQFVGAGGYDRADLWVEAWEAGIWENGKVRSWKNDEPRAVPYDYGEPFNLPNHPVVGVTWYEALAYTRWLDGELKNASGQGAVDSTTKGEWMFWNAVASGKYRVTLPSEAEWEKSARGGLQIPYPRSPFPSSQSATFQLTNPQFINNPHPARIYPWGDKITPDHANYRDTGLGTTNAVGAFPKGASPYDVLDLSGNVWEWTLSCYKKNFIGPTGENKDLQSSNAEARVLSGGAFSSSHALVRCAARGKNIPHGTRRVIGFRVVLSPMHSEP